jgi:hypothetical protein
MLSGEEILTQYLGAVGTEKTVATIIGRKEMALLT